MTKASLNRYEARLKSLTGIYAVYLPLLSYCTNIHTLNVRFWLEKQLNRLSRIAKSSINLICARPRENIR